MEPFNFLKVDSNTDEADGKDCSKCNKPIELIPMYHTNKKGERVPVIRRYHGTTYKVYDRSNRVDCEHPTQGLVSYHIDCWKETVLDDE